MQYVILKHLQLPRSGSRILHVAPERHLHKLFKEASGELYHPCDYDPQNKNYKKLGGVIYEIDLCRDLFRFPSSCFDMIVHNHVLEHIPCSVQATLEEHKRILAPGGSLIFSVPFRGTKTEEDLSPELNAAERIKRFGQADHMRIFGASDFPVLLREIFGTDIYFDTAKLWSERQHEDWAIPYQLAKRINGVSNFVWQKR